MDKIIDLLVKLILSFLGLIAPIMGLLISSYKEGFLKLASQAESERKKTEINITNQLKKIANPNEDDIKEIKNNLKKLESIKKIAKRKLFYLNPNKQLINLFAPLIISFIIIITFYSFNLEKKFHYFVLIGVCIIALFYFARVIFKLFSIISEVKNFQEDEKKNRDLKIIEVLMELSEQLKKGIQVFLEKIYIEINGNKITNDSVEIKMQTQEKSELKIKIINSDERMAKNIEIGLIFDSNFIIETNSDYSLYINKDGTQIVRFTTDLIQGNTSLILKPPTITPLNKNKYTISTFVKGENIKTSYKKFTLIVE